jgi:TATA-box binding protein (TBP) (component of TFIID and TFIIIB)
MIFVYKDYYNYHIMNDVVIKNIYDNMDLLMKDLFDKYSTGKDIFKNIEYKTLKNTIEMNIVFSELKIVTITINAVLPIDIDYNNFILFINRTESFIPKTKIDKNIEFYNCFSFKININNNLLNVKYFKNGSLQITGCKKVENITQLILLLVKHIADNKDDLIEINPSNYKAIKLLEKYKINELRKIGNEYLIPNYNQLKKQNIIEKIIHTTKYLDENKIVNKYNKNNIKDFDIADANIRISMINSSYGIYNNIDGTNYNFEIDRKRLFNFIKNNTKLSCYYDNTQHQGVKINFMFNENKDGECRCENNCILVHKKNRICKKITILIFNSAKIVITGSNSLDHTKLCYKFVNNIIFDNYKDFVQIKF